MSDTPILPCDTDIPTPPSIFSSNTDRSAINRLDTDSFFAVLDLPPCLRPFNVVNCGDVADISIERLELTLKGVKIPPLSVPSQKMHFMGATRGESSKKVDEYSDVTVSFKLDGGMVNYHTIHTWLRMLVDDRGVSSTFGKSDYSTTFTILMLDQFEKPIGSFTYHGVFPTELGELNLDSSVVESVNVDFTFSFDYISFDILSTSI